MQLVCGLSEDHRTSYMLNLQNRSIGLCLQILLTTVFHTLNSQQKELEYLCPLFD